MAKKDYYNILGVNKNATDEEIKKAYRQKAKLFHPDLHNDKTEAEKRENEVKFKQINHAYEVLSDKQKRASYDNFGDENGPMGAGGAGGFGGASGFGGFGGFEDIISNIFDSFGGGSRRSSQPSGRVNGSDIGVQLTIDFNEAAFGCTKEINITKKECCSKCKGTGAKDGTAFKTCGKCGGTGRVSYRQNTIFGTVSNTTTCDACKGKGKIITSTCKACGGKGYNKTTHKHRVVIPAGISHGQRMTYHEEGDCGLNGGSPGNLIVIINVKPHKYFKRKDYDIFVDVPISFATAAAGGDIDVPTLDGNMKYSIPEGTETATVFRVKGKGIKHLRRDMHGDLYFTINIETPKKLSSKQKELLKTFEESISKSQMPNKKNFYS